MILVQSLMLLLFLLQESPAKLVTAVPPAPPLASVNAGEVILDGLVDPRGDLREIRLIQGSPPFVDAAIRAASEWRFTPGQANAPIASRVSITMLFRPRAIFSTGPPVRRPIPSNLLDEDRPPFPVTISQPSYPLDSVAEGVVILGLQIGPDGTIDDLQVIGDVPTLVEPAERAVRSWTFLPAMIRGQVVAGTAIVAISFLRPVVETRP